MKHMTDPKPEAGIESSLYDIPVVDIDGNITTLTAWRNKVLLIVNVASRCGFNKQYHALEALQQQFTNDQFAVLAFPCNQFLHQEPASSQQILANCQSKYKITFPIFHKINVNGRKTAPLYKYLKNNVQRKPWFSFIPWNFTKFLIDKNGVVLQRYAPTHAISKIEEKITQLLK